MTGRYVKEWIGKTADSKLPKRVGLRIWRREDGRCYLTGKKIMPGDKWHWEHKRALSLGGENRESNIFPALVEPHKKKSAEESGIRAKADAIAKRHIGLPPPKKPIPSRGFPKSDKPKREARAQLQPKVLFR